MVTTYKGATLREREDCEEGLSAKDGKQKDAKAESRLLGSLGAPTLAAARDKNPLPVQPPLKLLTLYYPMSLTYSICETS